MSDLYTCLDEKWGRTRTVTNETFLNRNNPAKLAAEFLNTT